VQGAQTDKDFKNKASISLKELRINMKILPIHTCGYKIISIKFLDEVAQLITIIATIIKNKK